MLNQAKLSSLRRAPQYKYGFAVPCDYTKAVLLEAKIGNTHWQDAVHTEVSQLFEYGTFID